MNQNIVNITGGGIEEPVVTVKLDETKISRINFIPAQDQGLPHAGWGCE